MPYIEIVSAHSRNHNVALLEVLIACVSMTRLHHCQHERHSRHDIALQSTNCLRDAHGFSLLVVQVLILNMTNNLSALKTNQFRSSACWMATADQLMWRLVADQFQPRSAASQR